MNSSSPRSSYSISHCYMAVGLVSFLILLYFIFLANTRNVDGDEGLYLEAARLIAMGKKPYFDFFYQQMPLIPYLYALWMKVFGFTLYTARYFSAILTASACGLVLWYVARTTRNILFIYLSAVLLAGNGLLLAWAPVIKTHSLNTFCLVLATVLLLEWRRRPERPLKMLATAAFAIGVGVNARLTLGPFLVLYFIFVYFNSPRDKWKNLAVCAVAVLITSLPTFYFFFSNPAQFIQFNFTYHTHVYPGIAPSGKRLEVAEAIFPQVQILLLLVLSQGGILLLFREPLRKALETDEALIAASLFLFILIHMSAAEPFTQYFSAMVPLLVMEALPVLKRIVSLRAARASVFLVPLLGVYLFYSIPLREKEINSMGSNSTFWELEKLEKVARTAETIIEPGEYCLTWWPGYAFMVHCRSIPGMENHMRNHAIEEGIPGEVVENYKMMSNETLMNVLEQRRYRVVIDGIYHKPGVLDEDIRHVLTKNYRLVKEVEGVRIYVAGASIGNGVNAKSFDGRQ